MRELPTPEYLRQRLDYDPDAGKFLWKRTDLVEFAWNQKFAGKEAFISRHDCGYLVGSVGGDSRKLYAHRVAWAMVYGEWPEFEIDHINHKRDDNRIANLRSVPREMNGKNLSLRKDSTSGYPGVYLNKIGKWHAQIKVKYKRYSLGYHDKKEDAIAARREAERRFGFHINHGSSLARCCFGGLGR